MTVEDDLDEPATKRYVKNEIGAVRGEMHAGFTALMEAMVELKNSIRPTVTEVVREVVPEVVREVVREVLPALVRKEVRTEVLDIVHTEVRTAVGITEEEWQRRVAVLDEKYKDLPPRVAAVEDDLEAHKRDFRLHKRPRVP